MKYADVFFGHTCIGSSSCSSHYIWYFSFNDKQGHDNYNKIFLTEIMSYILHYVNCITTAMLFAQKSVRHLLCCLLVNKSILMEFRVLVRVWGLRVWVGIGVRDGVCGSKAEV